jgi:hypothetical protein
MFWTSVWTEEQARIEDCELGAVRGMLLLAEGRVVGSGKGNVRPVSRLAGVCGIYRLHGMNGYVWLCDLHVWHETSLMPSLAPEVKLRQRGNSGDEKLRSQRRLSNVNGEDDSAPYHIACPSPRESSAAQDIEKNDEVRTSRSLNQYNRLLAYNGLKCSVFYAWIEGL